MNIKFLRTKTGENIVSEINEQDPMDLDLNIFSLKCPIRILTGEDDMGRDVMHLVEWIPYSLANTDVVLLNKNDLLTVLNPSDKMRETYEEFITESQRRRALKDEELEKELNGENVDPEDQHDGVSLEDALQYITGKHTIH